MKNEPKEKNDNEILELKLSNVENRIIELHSYFKYTISSVTLILTIAAIILSYLSFSSKSDVNEAVEDMEKKFEILSQKALMNPHLEIYHSQINLNGQVIEVNLTNKVFFDLDGITLKNHGEGMSKFMNIKLYMSDDINQRNNEWWGKYSATDSSFCTYYLWGAEIPISPGDFWNIKSFKGRLIDKELKSTECKMEVFYGGKKSATAHFRLEFIEA